MFKKGIASVLLVILASLVGCTNSSQVKQAGRDHSSGWSDQIRSLASHSVGPAQLAYNVYKDADQFDVSGRYRWVRDFEEKRMGFFASLYKENDQENYILAFRGTDSLADFKSGNNPIFQRQNGYALAVFDQVRDLYSPREITVVGHSLGGGIAIHVSLNRANVKAYSFNGSPVFHSDGPPFKNERYSIVEYGDPLKLGRILGREATQLYTSVGCTNKKNPFSQHAMKLLANCLITMASYENHSSTREGVQVLQKPQL
ncbi:Mbeg1-like protein [Pseudomonas sp. zfem002]|uniref:Mbeg1-like protein n=1 Tax=Pseudomonas sp. zfem002 TaxID=3078197 RepID=UPI002934B422|nr:Mbeg1-like protein [Pseudomonas sp. zfem002]